ncbi:MAG TPA: histidine phosphatase family protein [Allocoleopsis sp.]
MKLYFVRHGESEANVLHVISNRGYQHGLTSKGRQQAQDLATQLQSTGASHIYTSPLLRAVQTAAILSNQLQIPYTLTDALREYDCGVIEGKSDAESWQLHRQLKADWLEHRLWECRIEQGESFLDIRSRFVPWIDQILETHASSENLILVGHGGTFACMLPLILTNLDIAFVLNQSFPNTSYVLAEVTCRGLVCLEWCGTVLLSPDHP